jgi:hypothetical protein
MQRRINILVRKVCFEDSLVRRLPKFALLLLILLSASVFQFATTTVAQSNELIVNGAFETGNFDGWRAGSECLVVNDALASHSGSYMARVGSPDSWSTLSQTISIPDQAIGNLSFWYLVETYARLIATLRASNGSVIQSWQAINDSTWHEVSFQLQPAHEETDLTIQFKGVGYNEGRGGVWLAFIDDVSLTYESQIACPPSWSSVTIDGKWTTSEEWADALTVTLAKSISSSRNATAYLYAKHDDSNFYFLVDFVSATSLNAAYDGAAITIDPLHNGGNGPQPDDRRFDSTWTGGQMAVGTGAAEWNWDNPLPQGVEIDMSVTNSSNLSQQHEVSEFKIPFSVFPELQDTIGFAAAAYAGSSTSFKLAIWPEPHYRDIPNTWGELTVSSEPIPEFELVPFVMVIGIVATLVILNKRRWQLSDDRSSQR